MRHRGLKILDDKNSVLFYYFNMDSKKEKKIMWVNAGLFFFGFIMLPVFPPAGIGILIAAFLLCKAQYDPSAPRPPSPDDEYY